MYFIVNTTKRNIVLSDLSISLGPRQAKDLDKMFKRDKIEESQHLASAVSKGYIQIKMKDGKQSMEMVTPPSVVHNDIDIDSLQDALKDGIKEGVQEAVKAVQQPQSGITPEDMKNMIQEMKNMQEAAKPELQQSGLSAEDMNQIMGKVIEAIKNQQGNTVIVQEEQQVKKDEEVEIDEEKLSEMHTRAVDKKLKNTEISGVNYKEEQSDFDSNLDELDQLLG
jgi:hypothetical protein